ncbi:DUF3108 domain-containing protein [Myxococcota bacterium]|nr:DUF3108 domain-containing protein [Myxococcota bacterium]
MTGALALGGLAFAAPGEERLTYAVSTLGLSVGHAEVVAAPLADGYTHVQARAWSAAWYERFYRLDERLESEWRADQGSRRYAADVVEGDYVESRRISLSPTAVSVRFRRPEEPGVDLQLPPFDRAIDDPLSVVWRLRHDPPRPGAAETYELFDGKRLVRLRASSEPAGACPAPYEARSCLRVKVGGAKPGEVKSDAEVHMLLSDDADHLPVVATLSAPGLDVTATLTAWSPGAVR